MGWGNGHSKVSSPVDIVLSGEMIERVLKVTQGCQHQRMGVQSGSGSPGEKDRLGDMRLHDPAHRLLHHANVRAAVHQDLVVGNLG